MKKEVQIPDQIHKMLTDFVPYMGNVDNALFSISQYCDDSSGKEDSEETKQEKYEDLISAVLSAMKIDEDLQKVGEFLNINNITDEIDLFKRTFCQEYGIEKVRSLAGWTATDERLHEAAAGFYQSVRIEFIKYLLLTSDSDEI